MRSLRRFFVCVVNFGDRAGLLLGVLASRVLALRLLRAE
jgi:hypothetical protein